MKTGSLSILFLGILLLAACNRKTAEVVENKPIEKHPEPVVQETAPVETVDVVSAKPHLVASMKKTACYGKCPVFEVKFYSDGKATYHGKKFVDREGYYVAVIDDFRVSEIVRQANEVGFFKLDNTYPKNGRTITDLPNTITMVNDGIQEKSITNNHEAPASLLDFEQYLEAQIDQLEWTEVESLDD